MARVQMNQLHMEHYVEQGLLLDLVLFDMLPQNVVLNCQQLCAPLKPKKKTK